MYRTETMQDRPAVIRLWQQVFGDPPELITRCLDVFAGPGQVYVAPAEHVDGIEAMLLAVPCEAAQTQGVYLYALATTPARRGAGVMSRLMAFAEETEGQRGAKFAALIPADEGLYGYYQKRGYTGEVLLRRFSYTIEEEETAGARAGQVRQVALSAADEAARLQALRAAYVRQPFIAFSPLRMALAWADVQAEGGRLVEAADGYAVYLSGKETVLVPELFARSMASARRLLQDICRKTGRQTVQVTLVNDSTLFPGEGTTERAGLVKVLAPGQRYEGFYLRFALDELSQR